MVKRQAVAKPTSLLRIPILGGCAIAMVSAGLVLCRGDGDTRQLPNGLKVTSIADQHNDVAQILGIKTRRVQVQLPRPNQTLDCSLEVRHKGQPSYTLSGFGVGPIGNSQTEVLVGLHPLNDAWDKSSQVQTFIRASSKGNSMTSETHGIKSNPFERYGSLESGPAFTQQDGSLLLMVGSDKGAAPWPIERDNDVALVLVLRAKDIQYTDDPTEKKRHELSSNTCLFLSSQG